MNTTPQTPAICESCGVELDRFPSGRTTPKLGRHFRRPRAGRRFCSGACRQKAYRQRKAKA